jgi:hypothetical protein
MNTASASAIGFDRFVVKSSCLTLTLVATSSWSRAHRPESRRNERGNLLPVLVDADDVVAEIRKAGPGHRPT